MISTFNIMPEHVRGNNLLQIFLCKLGTGKLIDWVCIVLGTCIISTTIIRTLCKLPILCLASCKDHMRHQAIVSCPRVMPDAPQCIEPNWGISS